VVADDTSGVRIFPPAIFLVSVAAGFVARWIWPVHAVPAAWAPAARVAGLVLIAGWLGIGIWAVATFRGVGTTPNPTQPTTALAFGGPYRFTRNPMYLGFVLMQIGVALAMNVLWPLVFVVPSIVVTDRAVIAPEEAYLERRFGASYLEYKRRVRRWI
jgi:protein-S-isoprenylcysteine O-methyltransferase Ste14